jgi:hypothetical protein
VSVRRRAVAPLLLTLVTALLLAGAAPASARPAAPDLEQELVRLINRERAAAGRSTLRVELQMTRIARDWSTTMRGRGALSHRPSLGAVVDGDWRRLGENVGVGQEIARLHRAFMDSPGHRANVLGDFTGVGVGVVQDGSRIWVTANFVKGRGSFPLYRDTRGNVHLKGIETVFARATTAGCRTDRYCPGDAVTRGQMATFLTRELGLAPRKGNFRDVPSGHPHAAAIGALAASGITEGCEPGRFCPERRVSRAQMASFLTRARGLAERQPTGFGDVGADHRHAGAIGALQHAGITGGCRRGAFCPSAPVSRGQMATFLSEAF